MSDHVFQWAGEGNDKYDKAGRRLRVCRICGKPAIGLTHRRARPATEESISPANALPVVEEPDAMTLLRIACKQVIQLPIDAIGWRMRLRVLDVLKAFDIKDDLPLMREDVPPPPRERVSATVAVRKDSGSTLVRRAIRGDYARIGLQAVEQGWHARRTASHVLFTQPATGATFTLPTTGGEGRGYKNAKADAKRAGLDTEGL